MTAEQELGARKRAFRKNKFKMRYRGRLLSEISSTLEKLALLRELQSEGLE